MYVWDSTVATLHKYMYEHTFVCLSVPTFIASWRFIAILSAMRRAERWGGSARGYAG